MPFEIHMKFWLLSPSDERIGVWKECSFNLSSRVQHPLSSATAQRSNVNESIFLDPNRDE